MADYKSPKTIRHLQRCRDSAKTKKQRRKNKVARDKFRQLIRKREMEYTKTLRQALFMTASIAQWVVYGGINAKLPETQTETMRKAA